MQFENTAFYSFGVIALLHDPLSAELQAGYLVIFLDFFLVQEFITLSMAANRPSLKAAKQAHILMMIW